MDRVVDETSAVQPARGEQAEDIERVVGDLLGRSVKQQDLISTLEYALDRLLAIEGFSFDRRGAIFLVDDTGRQLEMTVSRGLPGAVQASCAIVPFGRCLCGRVAETAEALWAETVDDRHEVHTGEAEHGHHCVPMKAEGRVVGVINIYVRSEHVCTRAETDMLAAVADVLAGVVQRDQFARARDEHRGRLEAILATFDGLIYMASPDYHIEYMNDKFMQLVGGDPVGKVCYQAIHGRQDVCPWCTNARVFAGETVRWEVKMRLDGRYYMVVNRPVVHPDGTMSKLSMSTDITERKLAELDLMRALEENTKTLDGVVQTLASTTSQRDPYTASIRSASRASPWRSPRTCRWARR